MKKFTLFFVALFAMVFYANAVEVNNPKDADGFYIVKWDCANNTWAASNDFEVDQTFTFAIDVTGTPLENWLRETPTNAGATRSIAFNKWTGFGDLNGDSHRLKQISGNIYGATWNIFQLGSAAFESENATTIDAVTTITGQIFGYEYTSDNPGASWWQWPAGMAEGESVLAPDKEQTFATLPYTGTKTSPEFYNDDYPGLFEESYPIAGYAPACANVPSSVKQITFDPADVIGVEFHNLQGMKLSMEPENGIYIKTSILSNGNRVGEKVIKNQK